MEPGLPRYEDGAKDLDKFGHPRYRIIKYCAVMLFDLSADLSAEAENEPALCQQLMVVIPGALAESDCEEMQLRH